jgi:hypothetical protein
MQKYQQYYPVARTSEVLADRWTLLIVRELILGSHRFNEIERGLPGIKPVIEALGVRGVRWAFDDPRPEELDPGLLVWKIHQRINRELLPDRRTVVEFDFTGPRGRRVWLVLEPREVSVCVTPPRFDSDLVLRADLASFYGVWLGRVDYVKATRCGAIVVDGPPALAKQLPRWLLWSPMAGVVRDECARRRPPREVALA